MKSKSYIFLIAFLTSLAVCAVAGNTNKLKKENVNLSRMGDKLMVSMDIVLDSTRLSSNHQLFVTPVITNGDGTHNVTLPTVLFNGRNMHYRYLRNNNKALAGGDYDVVSEVYYKNGKMSKVAYAQTTPMQEWMESEDAVMRVMIDTCGCGTLKAKGLEDYPLNLVPKVINQAPNMVVMPFPVPIAGDDKISVHQGKAKVQFEVDKFQLHDKVYSYTNRFTKRRHTIDNRQQLKTIDDSINYALSSPNVELVSLDICGYASPESPYNHNEYLATNRAKAVLTYVERHDGVPAQLCSYSAVPENWKEFRNQVVAAKGITEKQRADLLELIDRPIHSTSDYDRKETELKTSPKFSALYRGTIHPDWFPDLRYTEFTIRTHLKPMTDEQLRQVMKEEPQRMSLSQFYRVALSYGQGTQDFKETLKLALKYYPNDPTANMNAAAMAIEAGNYDDAKPFLKLAGESDDANILRGIVATNDGDLDVARAFFTKAIKQPEAQRNLNLIK